MAVASHFVSPPLLYSYSRVAPSQTQVEKSITISLDRQSAFAASTFAHDTPAGQVAATARLGQASRSTLMSARARGSLLLATLILVLPVAKARQQRADLYHLERLPGIGGFDAVLRPGADTALNPRQASSQRAQ